MKKLLFIGVLIVFVCAQCGDCDDCGKLPERQYGLINKLDGKIMLNISGDSLLAIDLPPNDTTELWSTLVDPRTCCCEDTYFFKNGLKSSFPFSAEQITISFGVEEIGIFSRCQYLENCIFSVFEPNSFGSDGVAYFEIDSLSLCLK